jgi:hypothetical protein
MESEEVSLASHEDEIIPKKDSNVFFINMEVVRVQEV